MKIDGFCHFRQEAGPAWILMLPKLGKRAKEEAGERVLPLPSQEVGVLQEFSIG